MLWLPKSLRRDLCPSTPPDRQLSWLGLRPTSGSLVLSYLQLESCAWKATKQHLHRPPLHLRSKKQKTSNFCPVAPCFFSRTIHNGKWWIFHVGGPYLDFINKERAKASSDLFVPYIFWGLGLSNKLNFNVVVFFDRTWLKEENLGGWFSTLMAFDLSSLQRKSTKLEVLDATQAGVKTFLYSMIYSRSYIWVGKYMIWFHLESNSMREVSLPLLTWYV